MNLYEDDDHGQVLDNSNNTSSVNNVLRDGIQDLGCMGFFKVLVGIQGRQARKCMESRPGFLAKTPETKRGRPHDVTYCEPRVIHGHRWSQLIASRGQAILPSFPLPPRQTTRLRHPCEDHSKWRRVERGRDRLLEQSTCKGARGNSICVIRASTPRR